MLGISAISPRAETDVDSGIRPTADVEMPPVRREPLRCCIYQSVSYKDSIQSSIVAGNSFYLLMSTCLLIPLLDILLIHR